MKFKIKTPIAILIIGFGIVIAAWVLIHEYTKDRSATRVLRCEQVTNVDGTITLRCK